MMNNQRHLHRPLLAFLFVFFVGACSTAHDGPFEYIKGRAIDAKVIDDWKKIQVTAEEVQKFLGTPDSRKQLNQNIEQLSFRSIRRRTSFETTFGFKHSVSFQDLIETTDFIFSQGRLMDVRQSTEVRVGP